VLASRTRSGGARDTRARAGDRRTPRARTAIAGIPAAKAWPVSSYTIERAEQRRAERHALAVRLAGLGSIDGRVESGADA
jgi:hypothetical protein